jgi:hypothetical protein
MSRAVKTVLWSNGDMECAMGYPKRTPLPRGCVSPDFDDIVTVCIAGIEKYSTIQLLVEVINLMVEIFADE